MIAWVKKDGTFEFIHEEQLIAVAEARPNCSINYVEIQDDKVKLCRAIYYSNRQTIATYPGAIPKKVLQRVLATA